MRKKQSFEELKSKNKEELIKSDVVLMKVKRRLEEQKTRED